MPDFADYVDAPDFDSVPKSVHQFKNINQSQS